jgi:hypothetical protein
LTPLPTLPLPHTPPTSKHALILPLVYGHVVLLKKFISPYFTFTVVKGRRPALFSLFHWVKGRRPALSLRWRAEGPHSFHCFTEWRAAGPHFHCSEGPKARTLFTVSLSEGPQACTFTAVIPTTPTREWQWFHRVRCGS